jgi:hypothetical protein
MTPASVRINVPAWAWMMAAFALAAFALLTQENGTVLTNAQAMYLHELTHDARHALGVPCH